MPSGILPLVTTPVNNPTDATAELLLLHVPPKEGSLSVMLTPPEHILVGPVIAAGGGKTEIVVVGDAQPLE